MTKSRKAVNKEKKSAHQTVHLRAMTDPKVAKMVVVLRRRWAGMGPVERGDRLRELVALGCSTRGLEKELQQSATSIRRHMALAELPDEDREAIGTGRSAKKILEQKASDERYRRQHERVIEDRRTGALSDEIADVILEVCRTKDWPRRAPVSRESARQLFSETVRALQEFEANGRGAVRVSKKLGLKKLLNKIKPSRGKEEFVMAHQAEWLANVVWAKAPERPIWESAIQKAEQRVNELTPKKSPSQLFQERMRRLAEISASTFRPPYKGARSLERQGRPTQSSKLP